MLSFHSYKLKALHNFFFGSFPWKQAMAPFG